MLKTLAKLTERQKKGAHVEELAQHFLEAQGLQLIVKNFCCKPGEVDLIMQDCDTIVFVEVRHRARSDYGTAAESITRSKQLRIIKASTLFMMQRHWYGQKTVRFDVITLDGKLSEFPQINWIKQAFYCD